MCLSLMYLSMAGAEHRQLYTFSLTGILEKSCGCFLFLLEGRALAPLSGFKPEGLVHPLPGSIGPGEHEKQLRTKVVDKTI